MESAEPRGDALLQLGAAAHGSNDDAVGAADVASREASGGAGGGAPTWRSEALAQAKAAAPLILFNALQFALSAISIAAVGRTGAQRMAAAALARCV